MPTFSLFPKKSYMDLSAHESFSTASSSRHSPSTSLSSSMTDTSTASSVTSVSPPYAPTSHHAHDFLPPIRTASPIQIHHREREDFYEEPFEGYDDVLADYTDLPGCYSPPGNDRRHYRESLQKPLPEVPQTIFDRLQAPLSFHPTRRAPMPPGMSSWIDLQEEEEDDRWGTGPPDVVPVAVGGAGGGGGGVGQHGKIEREIMRMLQFNEEKEVERRVMEEKKAGKRKSNFMGFLTGKLRRSPSVSTKGMCVNEFSSKRASYMY